MDILDFHPDKTKELTLLITGTNFAYKMFNLALDGVDKKKVRFQTCFLILLANPMDRARFQVLHELV